MHAYWSAFTIAVGRADRGAFVIAVVWAVIFAEFRAIAYAVAATKSAPLSGRFRTLITPSPFLFAFVLHCDPKIGAQKLPSANLKHSSAPLL